ncbi:MAG: Tol-Pal system beta propeller repeat protein TolB [Nitrospirae bacterium]|uniref:Tol-Pal system beta propeller repeat protein TolB n=1 Tax=Candidatus Magnetobacterium casense TaxID=1455061 RepID=UPI0006978710|nr:Tol-Pal system beta propeller repeat protein TolB [Candidatus Magnetobacterium casensis]MBF0337822.1 Tol-Pal system beta propeller repeat protein TolB [Nitrospirota bacterium]
MKKSSLINTLQLLVLLLVLCAGSVAQGRVYIDVTSPGGRKLPIAVQDFTGIAEGTGVSDIIKSDLQFTNLFSFVDKNAFIETSDTPFNPDNWRPLGVEAVVKGVFEGTADSSLSVTVSVYDVVEARNILKKNYSTRKDLLRPLAHKIADDIYEAITGQKGIFSTRIAFVGYDSGEGRSIYLMDFDGQRIKKIVKKSSLIARPRWSPDGKRLTYSAMKKGKWTINLLNFDTASETEIFSSKATDLVGDFTPDGKALLLSSSSKGSPDIYMLQLNSKVLNPLTYADTIEVSPASSPDGRQIVYVSNRSGSPQLYIMNSDGSDSRRLTFEGNYNTAPDWSPAGDLITFCMTAGGRFQIATVKPDGSGLTVLTSAGNNEEPAFSPDGRYIVFTSDRDGAKGVYAMSVNGEGQHRISPKNIRALGPSWSHN